MLRTVVRRLSLVSLLATGAARFALTAGTIACAAGSARAAQWEVHTNANDLVAVSAIGTSSVYAASLDGLHRYDTGSGTFEQFFREPGGLLSNAVRAVDVDDSQTIWIGTADAGVSLLTTSRRWIAITDFDGLPSDTVSALAPQAGGLGVEPAGHGQHLVQFVQTARGRLDG